MKTAFELQHDVQDELDFEPSLDAAAIGVSASHDGVVTLNGHVGSYAEKIAAQGAVKRVRGVKAVANDLKVTLWPGTERDDTSIAQAAVQALEWNTWVAGAGLTTTVKQGWVTLEGTVDWEYQREAARKAVEHLVGVKGVTNLVALKPRVEAGEVKQRIESAFQRAASLDAAHVTVDVAGSRVTLHGMVRSWSERDDAQRAAWRVPGVTAVQNDITVGTVEYAAA